MKKIIFITSNLSNGGAERVTVVLANAMHKLGHEVSIVHMKDASTVYQLDKGIKKIHLFDKKKNRLSVPKKILRLAKLMRKEKNAAFIVMLPYESFYACLASFLSGRKITYSLRNDPANQKGKLFDFLYKVAYPSAKSIVFQTEDAMNYFPEKVRKKGSIIVNPINDTLPVPYEGERDKEFVSVGRLTAQKNFPLLLEAYKTVYRKHPDWKLKIYGQGDLEGQLKTLAGNKGLVDAVEFCGFEKNVPDKIRKSGGFVLSSDFEGISNAMLEALAMGLPCVCTDCPVGGARLVIKDQVTGMLVPVRDVEKLQEAMCRIIEDPEFARSLSRHAVDLCREFTPARIAQQWVDVV